MNRRFASVPPLLLALLTVSSPSLADPIDPGVRLVRYDDLDLSTSAGVKALHRRIEVALDEVCLDPNGPSPGGAVNMPCKVAGRREAFAQIDRVLAWQQGNRATEHASALPAPRPDAAAHR
jgi:UrcA family protein